MRAPIKHRLTRLGIAIATCVTASIAHAGFTFPRLGPTAPRTGAQIGGAFASSPTPLSPELLRYATILSISILLFGVLVIATVAFLASRKVITRENAFKLIGLSFVVTVGVFLIPAGYDQAQIAPTSALLGTIVGYLFGRTGDSQPGRNDHKPKQSQT